LSTRDNSYRSNCIFPSPLTRLLLHAHISGFTLPYALRVLNHFWYKKSAMSQTPAPISLCDPLRVRSPSTTRFATLGTLVDVGEESVEVEGEAIVSHDYNP
jgi:hypothetical protein